MSWIDPRTWFKSKEPAAPPIVPSFSHLQPLPAYSGEVPWEASITLAAMSVAAYDTDTLIQDTVIGLGATQCVTITKNSARAIVASDAQNVVVAFRGTSNITDGLADLDIVPARESHDPRKHIHAGFYDYTMSVFDRVASEMFRQGAAHKHIWFTGHSLGGAMAAVFGYLAINPGRLSAAIITFGQPFAFSLEAAREMVTTHGSRYIRFVNQLDPVPRVPPLYHSGGACVHLSRAAYRYAMPQVSVIASVTSQLQASAVPIIPGLIAMSEAEFAAFKQALAASGSKLIEPHLMSTYMSRLQRMAATKVNQTGQ